MTQKGSPTQDKSRVPELLMVNKKTIGQIFLMEFRLILFNGKYFFLTFRADFHEYGERRRHRWTAVTGTQKEG